MWVVGIRMKARTGVCEKESHPALKFLLQFQGRTTIQFPCGSNLICKTGHSGVRSFQRRSPYCSHASYCPAGNSMALVFPET